MPRLGTSSGSKGGGRLATPAPWRKKFKCSGCRAKNKIHVEDLRIGTSVPGAGYTSLCANCQSCGRLLFFSPADINPTIWAMVVAAS